LSRPGSSRVEVLEVEIAPRDPRLRGFHVRTLESDAEGGAAELPLRGWVLPESEAALGAEILHEGSVVARAAVDLPRPELAAREDLPHAGSCGFERTLSLGAVEGELRLEVRAVLDPITRLRLATVTARVDPPPGRERVSVVIPCYRQAHFLAEAIESVLAQDHGALEVTVVDDGSPDNVGEVAARYPGVRCLRQPNGGLAAARNAGLEQATGEFVLFLDADDRLLPGAISRGLEQLRAEPEAMMAAGTWRLIGEAGEPLPADPPEQPARAYPALLESCFISTPAAVLYRRALFGQIGGFDPTVSASADYDLYLRTAGRFPVRLHPDPVAEYRRHGANMTRDPKLIMSSETTVLERQQPLVEGDPELREALQRGLARSRLYHGERLRLFESARRRPGGQGSGVGRLLEVLAVDVDDPVGEPLLGANVDSPTVGRHTAAGGLEIGGWALASSGRPEAVEVAVAGEVPADGIWQRRDDLATAFPAQAEAVGAGFEVAVDVREAPVEAELEVRARVEGAAVPFARLRVRRYWRGALPPGRTPLVSVAVVDEGAGAAALNRSLQGVGGQRHRATEVLVLSPAPDGRFPAEWEENGVRVVTAQLNGRGLRDEGLRQSNGELLLFLPAGAVLAPDALTLAVEMLARRPEACGLVDGDPGGVAAALYRRSAFAELGGFVEDGEDCALELSLLARRYDALLARGALVAGGG
jgi:Glycosyl transferase family 2